MPDGLLSDDEFWGPQQGPTQKVLSDDEFWGNAPEQKQNLLENIGSKAAAVAKGISDTAYGDIPIGISTLADIAGRKLGYTPPDIGLGELGQQNLANSAQLAQKLIPDTTGNRIAEMAGSFIPAVIPGAAIPYFVTSGVGQAKEQLLNEGNKSPQDEQDVNVLAKGALNGALAIVPGFKEMPLAAQKGIVGYAARTLAAGGTGFGIGSAISAVNDAVDKYTTNPDKVIGSSALQSGVETGLASLLFHGLVNEPLRGPSSAPVEKTQPEEPPAPPAQESEPPPATSSAADTNFYPVHDQEPLPENATPPEQMSPVLSDDEFLKAEPEKPAEPIPDTTGNSYNIHTPEGQSIQPTDLLSSVPQEASPSVVDPRAAQGDKIQQLIQIRQALAPLADAIDPAGRAYRGTLQAKEMALVKELTPPQAVTEVPKPNIAPEEQAQPIAQPDVVQSPEKQTAPVATPVQRPPEAVINRYKNVVADTAAKAGLPQLTPEQLDAAATDLAQSHSQPPLKLQTSHPADTVRITPTKDMDLNQQAMQQKLSDYVDKVVGKPGYGAKLVDSLKDQNNENVSGAFSPANKLVYIALNGEKGLRDYRDLFNTTRHEVIHALRDADVIPKDDWDIFSRRAQEKWIKQYKIDESYPHATKEQKIEEATAEALANLKDIKESPPIKRALHNVMNFFHRIGSFLKGGRFRSAEDVLRDIEAGKYSGKEGTPRSSSDIKFSRGYKNVPDSLMGFKKDGQNKGYDETKYPYSQDVRVKIGDETFEDSIKGMNKAHALERAHRNWPNADEITPIDVSPGVKFQRKAEEEKAIPEHLLNKIEKAIGKKTEGTSIERFMDGYKKLFAPEELGKHGMRFDARLAQNKVAERNAYDAIAKTMQHLVEGADKWTPEAKRQFIEDHETGNYPKDDVQHNLFKQLMDSTYKMEHDVMGTDGEKNYKENYISHLWEKPEAMQKFFESQIKKFGQDWFIKKRSFELVSEGEKAGFKLRTDNPWEIGQLRLMAGQDQIQKFQMLKALERDGLAGQMVLKDDKRGIANSANLPPAMLNDLATNNFRIIGPDSKAWYIHTDGAPLWKNAVEGRGLWENKTFAGDVFRGWQVLRNFWIPLKLGLSLFHPMHLATIHLASALAAAFENIAKGGSIFSKDTLKSLSMGLKMGFGLREGINPLRKIGGGTADHPYITALKTLPDKRTPDQQAIVQRYEEGGFTPLMSAQDTIDYRRNLLKALNQKELYKLPVPAIQAVLRGMSSPFFEHWIPALKAEAYMIRTQNALNRDPSLINNDGKRSETFRAISKDLERTYGEMNYDTLFWNKKVRDGFTASFLSAGWKLAQLYYYKGFLKTPQLLYDAIKTGKLDPKQITYNMIFSHVYGGLSLVAGAMFANMLGGQVNNLTDMVFPQTGEKQPDGSPVRVSLPFFNKEAFALMKDFDTKGLLGGATQFIGDQTLYPQIWNLLNNKDFAGRPNVSDPTNLEQIAHIAWKTIEPISLEQGEKAQLKKSEVLKLATLFGSGAAPMYAAESPFEHKLFDTYFRLNPSKGSAYQRDIQNDYRIAIANNDAKAAQEADAKLRETGMSGKQIQTLTHEFKTPFAVTAWSKIPAEEQIELFKSASPEEQAKFFPRMKQEAKQQVQYGRQ